MVQELRVEQAVALVACLVWREKSDAAPRVSEDMEGPVAALREAARRVAKVQQFLTKSVYSQPYTTTSASVHPQVGVA